MCNSLECWFKHPLPHTTTTRYYEKSRRDCGGQLSGLRRWVTVDRQCASSGREWWRDSRTCHCLDNGGVMYTHVMHGIWDLVIFSAPLVHWLILYFKLPCLYLAFPDTKVTNGSHVDSMLIRTLLFRGPCLKASCSIPIGLGFSL